MNDSQENAQLEQLFVAISQGNFTYRLEMGHPMSSVANQAMQWLDHMMLKELRDKVELTMAGFDTTINMAKLQRHADLVRQETDMMAAAAEEMSVTIRTMSEQADEVENQSADAKSSVDEGASSVQRIHEVMQMTNHRMASVMKEVRHLAVVSEDINHLLQTIRKISDQTNLLALNATIEAARAGDAGRGFAVVAGEVKNLSNQTKHAADNIFEKSSNIQSAVEVVVESIEKMTETVNDASSIVESGEASMQSIVESMMHVDGSMQGMHQATQEQKIASEELARGIQNNSMAAQEMKRQADTSLNNTDDIDQLLRTDLAEFANFKVNDAIIQLAKTDHMLWKKRLIDMMLGRGSIQLNEVTDHHQCRLGKWYDGHGKAEYNSSPAFIQLEKPHAKVHELAKQAVSKFNAGDMDGAMHDVEAIEPLSDKVVALLQQLEK